MAEFFRVNPRHVQAAISILEGHHQLFAEWRTATRACAPEIIEMPKKWLMYAEGTIRHPNENREVEEKKTSHLVAVIICALWLANEKSYPPLGEALLDGVMKEHTGYDDLERELRGTSQDLWRVLEKYTASIGVNLTGKCIAVVIAVAFIRSAKGVAKPIAEGDEALAVEEAVRFLRERPRNS